MQIFSPLVGVTFRGAEVKELVKGLTTSDGSFLSLEAEPSNPYDPNAVKVMYSGSDYFDGLLHIGYVAKENNLQLAEALAEGAEPKVEIVGFESTIKPTMLISWED